MTRKWLAPALLCLAPWYLLLLAGTSYAAATKPLAIGNWAVRAYFDDKTKQFDHCFATSESEGHHSISYAVDRQFSWQLSISSAAWNMAPGFAFTIDMKIDQEYLRSQRAIVRDGNTIEVQMTNPIEAFESLRRGRSMQLQAGGFGATLDLADSDQVFSALVGCVMNYAVNKKQNASGKAGHQKAKAGSAPLRPLPKVNGTTTNESTALARAIFAQLDIRSMRFIALNNVPAGFIADVIWQNNPFLGTVAVLPAGTVQRASLADQLVETIGKACQGSLFLIAARDTIDQNQVSRAFTVCQTPESTVASYHLEIPRAEGGAYYLTTINNGFQFVRSRETELFDQKLRSVVIGCIVRLREASASEP